MDRDPRPGPRASAAPSGGLWYSQVSEDQVEHRYLGDRHPHLLAELLAQGQGRTLRLLPRLGAVVGDGEDAAAAGPVDHRADAADPGQVLDARDDAHPEDVDHVLDPSWIDLRPDDPRAGAVVDAVHPVQH